MSDVVDNPATAVNFSRRLSGSYLATFFTSSRRHRHPPSSDLKVGNAKTQDAFKLIEVSLRQLGCGLENASFDLSQKQLFLRLNNAFITPGI